MCVMLLVPIRAYAQPQPDQDLSFQLMRTGPQNIDAYIAPWVKAYSLNINSGLFYTAKVHRFLEFDISLKHISVLTPTDKRTYDFVTPDYIDVRVPPGMGGVRLYRNVDYDGTVSAPSVAGEIQGAPVRIKPQSAYYSTYVNSHNGSDVTLETPRGYSTKNIPLLVPQFTLGFPLGFEAMVRYVPSVIAPEVGDAGKYKYMGYGLRFDIARFLPFLPIDAALHYATQKLEFKSEKDINIFTAVGKSYGIEASKTLWMVTLFAAYQREDATLTLHTFAGGWKPLDGAEIPFTVSEKTYKGETNSRVLFGTCFTYSTLNVFADYSFTPQPVYSLGIAFAVR